ncbi:vitamin-D-receptor interacting mediator subunit 4-domain-containing protein [Xylariomycetidae sp. FL0641]|nr:vitamin-D-receptor interacting mediator subunit 4-domain-containing protein [Xylariomycetidae sp. FL0641]
MDKQLDGCFDRVERALGTLIDSIAKYNPSANQVHELCKIDETFTKGLRDLQTHQSNYRRIQDLRAQTTSFDEQIKDTLRLLASTRKELYGAPATVFPAGPNYDINYDELLSYARRISKTTIPPAGAMNSLEALRAEAAAANANNPITTETAATTPAAAGTPNGMQSASATPAATANTAQASFDTASAQATPLGSSNPQQQPQQPSSGAPALPEHLQQHLNPHAGTLFEPWPSEAQVRQGAVATLAWMAEQGIEAEGYDPLLEKQRKEEAEEARRRAEEREAAERAERERRLREEQARARAERERAREAEAESWRRASVSVGVAGGGGGGGAPGVQAPPPPPQQQAQVQFQFMGGDDDDDDDD